MNEIARDHIVEFFEWYRLHDVPIDELAFDFQNQRIILVLDDCDRNAEDVPMRLVFKKATKYTFDYPVENFYFEIRDIYKAKLEKISDQNYELRLRVTMPAKNTGLEWDVGLMLIGFADMEVIGGLSREAMEYKWKEEE
jgi:hypothetical protein